MASSNAAAAALKEADAVPLAKHGEIGNGRSRVDVDINSKSKVQGGTSTSYLAARVARDHPEVAERAAKGEFKTTFEMAQAAGIEA